MKNYNMIKKLIINEENKSFKLIQNNTHPNFYLIDILKEKKILILNKLEK